MNPCEQMYRQFHHLVTNPKQKKLYDWILTNGKSFKGRKLSKTEEQKLQRLISMKLYTPKQCVLQSQVGANRELRYFEGQATTKTLGLPIEHAWLVDKDGNVWDATWKDGADYFGVEIPLEYVKSQMIKTGYVEFLLGRYYQTQNNGREENV